MLRRTKKAHNRRDSTIHTVVLDNLVKLCSAYSLPFWRWLTHESTKQGGSLRFFARINGYPDVRDEIYFNQFKLIDSYLLLIFSHNSYF